MIKRLIFVFLIFFFVFFFVFLVFLFIYPSTVLCSNNHSAEKGVIDLSKENIDHICPLKGEWGFKSLEDNNLSELEPGEAGESFIEVPSDWREKTGKRYTSGVYSLEIILPDNLNKNINITIPDLYEIIKVKVNGKNSYFSGDWEENKTGYTQKNIIIKETGRVKIDIAVKNVIFRMGGLYHPPLLGSVELKNKFQFIGIFKEAIIIGILFYIVLSHSFLFFTGFPNRKIIFLVLAALFYGLRGLLTGNINIPRFYSQIPLSLAYKLEYAFSFMGSAAIVVFSESITVWNSLIKKRGCKIIFVLGLIFTAACFLVPLKTLSRSVYVLQIFSISSLLFLIIINLPGVIQKKRSSIFIFIGGVIFFILVFLDIIYVNGSSLPFINSSQLGILLFLIAQSIALFTNISNAYLRAEDVANELEIEVENRTIELKKANDELKRLSTTDFLTGCNNRRSFFEIAERQIAISSRHNRPISILMLDIDNFKKINDKFGHGVGDAALKFITECCENELRKSDVLARLGGDEFVILLPETNIDDAFTISERIRKKITEVTSQEAAGLPPLSISGGLITLVKGETIFKALEIADYLLYQAKKNGRNQINLKPIEEISKLREF